MDLSGVLFGLAVVSAGGGIRCLQVHRALGRPPAEGPVPGTETWTVEEIEALRQGAEEVGTGLRRQVGIVAVARPGPDGVLTTPEGGVECVWWRAERIRYYTERVDGELIEQTERVSDNWSRSTFTLSDGTGTLVVRPADAEVVGAPTVYSRPEEFSREGPPTGSLVGRDTTYDLVYVEHALPVGTTIFVHGEAHDLDENFVTIGKPLNGGPLILSTEPERLLRDAAGKRPPPQVLRWSGYLLLGIAVVMVVLLYTV